MLVLASLRDQPEGWTRSRGAEGAAQDKGREGWAWAHTVDSERPAGLD